MGHCREGDFRPGFSGKVNYFLNSEKEGKLKKTNTQRIRKELRNEFQFRGSQSNPNRIPQ